jgi:hypothetical protein
MKTKLGCLVVEHDIIKTNNKAKIEVEILDMVYRFDCVSNLQYIWIKENGLPVVEGWNLFEGCHPLKF